MVIDEANKIRIKISKINSYWNRLSLLIPNVFRLARALDDDPVHLLEHQDLSRKELLVQSNGQKAKFSSSDFEEFTNMSLEVEEKVPERKHKSSEQIANRKNSKKSKSRNTNGSFES